MSQRVKKKTELNFRVQRKTLNNACGAELGCFPPIITLTALKEASQPVCVCQDAFRSRAIRASCGEQQRPTIKEYWTLEAWPAPSVRSSLVYYSQQVILRQNIWSCHSHWQNSAFVFVLYWAMKSVRHHHCTFFNIHLSPNLHIIIILFTLST